MTFNHGRSAGQMAVTGNFSADEGERGGFVGKCISFLASTRGRLQDEHIIRQSVEKLRELDDDTLRDIGLRRSEIESYVRNKVRLRQAASQR